MLAHRTGPASNMEHTMTEADDDNTLPAAPAAITVHEVTTMVLSALGANSKIEDPSCAALNWLAEKINFIVLVASFSPPRQHNAVDALISIDAFSAASALKDRLAGRRAAYEDMARTSRAIKLNPSDEPSFGEEQAEQALSALDALSCAIEAATPFLKPWPKGPEWREDQWGYHAPLFANLFRLCIASTNPGLSLGVSNQGPVSRFVAAAVKQIYGEDVKLDTVAKCIRRALKNDDLGTSPDTPDVPGQDEAQ